ncbi:kinase-like domain-containing protein [Lactarius sanguifluus]|nr:kinase-like domain-containing protein [Lactarius sanguifluus]
MTMLPIGTIPEVEACFNRPESPHERAVGVCYDTRWTSPLLDYPRCRGLDDFFQPSTSKVLGPPRLIYPRDTEWWDDDEDFSPFYPSDHPTERLDMSRFRILRCKRENASCRVAMAEHIDTGSIVRVKMFDRGSSASLSRAMNDVRAYKRIVEHPDSLYLVEALAAFRDSDGLYIVVPSFNDDLASYVGMMPSPTQLAKIILQVAYGLTHLHNIGIIHRSIKPSHILLTSTGDARISEFGLSHVHTEGPVKRGVVSFGCVPHWQGFLSPEAVLGHNDPMVDYWALGVTMFLVITGKFPFLTSSDLDRFAACPRTITEWSWHERLTLAESYVIAGLLDPNTMQRFDADRLVRCSYFTGVSVDWSRRHSLLPLNCEPGRQALFEYPRLALPSHTIT